MTPTTTPGEPAPVLLPEDDGAPKTAATVWPTRDECIAGMAEARAELPPQMQGYPVICSHSRHSDDSAELAPADSEPV